MSSNMFSFFIFTLTLIISAGYAYTMQMSRAKDEFDPPRFFLYSDCQYNITKAAILGTISLLVFHGGAAGVVCIYFFAMGAIILSNKLIKTFKKARENSFS